MLKIQVSKWDARRFKEIGRGGEAVVYLLKPDTVAKVFLAPNAPEFADSQQLQDAALTRIREMQTKILEVPKDLPKEIVAPTGTLINTHRQVVGYIMPFVKGTTLDKLTKTDSKISPTNISKLLMRLHDLVSATHAKEVVIGDFNENNIIITSNFNPCLIDVDSMQFGKYQCRTFLPRFVAPELIAAEKPPSRPSTRGNGTAVKSPPSFTMVAPHTKLTDWYSFLVIAMRLITFTDPFGGVVKGMTLSDRISKNLSVFSPGVVYPINARPLRELPRPLLEVFFRVFHKKERFVPDKGLFENLPQLFQDAKLQAAANNRQTKKARVKNEPKKSIQW